MAEQFNQSTNLGNYSGKQELLEDWYLADSIINDFDNLPPKIKSAVVATLLARIGILQPQAAAMPPAQIGAVAIAEEFDEYDILIARKRNFNVQAAGPRLTLSE